MTGTLGALVLLTCMSASDPGSAGALKGVVWHRPVVVQSADSRVEALYQELEILESRRALTASNFCSDSPEAGEADQHVQLARARLNAALGHSRPVAPDPKDGKGSAIRLLENWKPTDRYYGPLEDGSAALELLEVDR